MTAIMTMVVLATFAICGVKSDELDKSITCLSDRMTALVAVSWLDEVLPGYSDTAEDYRLNGDKCVGVSRRVGNKEFSTTVEHCGTTSVEHSADSTIVYYNTIRTSRGTQILEIECVYKTVYDIAPIMVITNPCSVMVTLQGFGSFNITASLFKTQEFKESDLFDEKDFPIMICDGVLIYFGLQVNIRDTNLELFTEECYASENVDPNADVAKHYMIVDGCRRNNIEEFGSDSLTNNYGWDAFEVVNDIGGDDSDYRLIEVQAEEMTLYIHSRVHVCRKNVVGTRCSQGCMNRKRRSVSDLIDTDYPGSTSTVITHGPLTKPPTCGN
ncbi:oncoprotein-induced transcript 3 protein-like [Glandiceps talaboti]